MKDWLLSDDKAKVGRPKLADNDALHKSRLLIILSVIISLLMLFTFVSIINNSNPLDYAYSLTLAKIFGEKENNNGFLVKSYYDKDSNYVLEVKASEQVESYSGSYRYTTYYLKGEEWVLKDTVDIPLNTNSFKIKIDSLKNKNKTWKVKLQIVNASKITKSFAPTGWTYQDGTKAEEKYTYKVFTVKGYYSPVTYEEIKEADKSTSKVTIITNKDNPRKFILNVPNNNYDVIVKYTDKTGKKVVLKSDTGVNGVTNYEVPNMNKATEVTFNVSINGVLNLEDYKLSNWTIKNINGTSYLTNTYVLKPESAYNN